MTDAIAPIKVTKAQETKAKLTATLLKTLLADMTGWGGIKKKPFVIHAASLLSTSRNKETSVVLTKDMDSLLNKLQFSLEDAFFEFKGTEQTRYLLSVISDVTGVKNPCWTLPHHDLRLGHITICWKV